MGAAFFALKEETVMAEKKFSWRHKAVECLRANPGKKFTATQVAEWIIANYPNECKDRYNKSEQKGNLAKRDVIGRCFNLKKIADKHGVIQYIDGGKDSDGKKTARLFWYDERYQEKVASHHQGKNKGAPRKHPTSQEKDNEASLYPKLTKYLYSDLKILSKRISEGSGSNMGEKGTNEWLYPDVVGMQDLNLRWKKCIQDCVAAHSGKKIKLWSFEVKRTINRANVRRYFFQAVSNSSWANYGYLVGTKLEDNAKDELQILAALHGIGFIKLNANMPKKSTVVIPAKERDSVDWDTANRLAESSDFREYIDACIRGASQKEIWDPVK